MRPRLKVLLGESDFAALRKGGYHYVDKSLFIEQVITDPAKVLLLPRPRRFGKTLNLSTLRYFFEKPKETYVANDQDHLTSISSETFRMPNDQRGLFTGLQIETSKESWEHFQKYSVIFLTFKDVKMRTWEDTWASISLLLSRLYQEHRYLLESSLFNEEESEFFLLILKQKSTPSQAAASLFTLSRHLSDYHQQQVVILIDEYDTPLHAAYENSYYQEAIEFFRNFLSGGFKDNRYLYKGVMTGILRVARESLFSGLNNLGVYSLLHHKFATSFGFTEAEVIALVEQADLVPLLPELKAWYNGYLFGGKTIYNPWSILNYLVQPEEGLKAYWVGTGENRLLRKLLLEQGLALKEDLETLLQGGRIQKPIDENIAFPDLQSSAQAVWSFLLFTGYLKAESTYTENKKLHAALRLVNHEIVEDFNSFTQVWFEKQLSGSMTVEDLLQGLFMGNAKQVQRALSKILVYNLSYHDFSSPKKKGKALRKGKKQGKGEQAESHFSGERTLEEQEEQSSASEGVYQALMIGLLAHLIDTYEVKSNRESGYGRADVLMLPKVGGKPGVVMEFKVAEKEQTLASALQEAIQQLEQKQYITELKERGAHPIYEYAVAFFGKQVLVQSQLQLPKSNPSML